MAFINIEIKARTTRAEAIRQYLRQAGAEHRGTDRQTDTYFVVPHGRLKLREGNIENNLIYYHRQETGGPKQSDVELVKTQDPPALKSVLAKALGVLAVVSKQREIYYIGNVKFHVDTLEGLGEFVEIEASNQFEDNLTATQLRAQCERYMKEFGLEAGDLVNESYSDMVMAQ
ncbi:MAG TPA: class IV adenylate cyclase [Chitinophagaceae bacterium]|nr:class IV adenylate cyclase [Chitinophagaceae bacterium]